LLSEPSNVNIFVPSWLPLLSLIIKSPSVDPDVGILIVFAADPSYISDTAPVNVMACGLGSLVGISGINPVTLSSKSVISSTV